MASSCYTGARVNRLRTTFDHDLNANTKAVGFQELCDLDTPLDATCRHHNLSRFQDVRCNVC